MPASPDPDQVESLDRADQAQALADLDESIQQALARARAAEERVLPLARREPAEIPFAQPPPLRLRRPLPRRF